MVTILTFPSRPTLAAEIAEDLRAEAVAADALNGAYLAAVERDAEWQLVRGELFARLVDEDDDVLQRVRETREGLRRAAVSSA